MITKVMCETFFIFQLTTLFRTVQCNCQLRQKGDINNPALPLWNQIENDLCRMTDYVTTLLFASGIDVNDIFDADADELTFKKGTLSRMIGNQFRNALRQSTMDELINSLEEF